MSGGEFLPPNQAIIQADIAQRQAAAELAPEPEPTYTADDLLQLSEDPDWSAEPAPESGFSPEMEEALYEQGLDPHSYREQIDEAIQEQVLQPHYQAGRLAAQREAHYAQQEQEAAAQAQAVHVAAFQSALGAQPDLKQVEVSGEAAAGYLDNALNVIEQDLSEQGYSPEQVSEAVQENPQAFYSAAAKLVNDAIRERAIIDRNLNLV
jgi:hypothetical protein